MEVLKNVIAIAAGILEGLGYAESTRAFLITESLHDIKELLFKMECNPKTMSPSAWVGGSRWIGVFYVHNDGKIYEDVFALPRGLRPVINLKADTQISSGNGTLNNPYVVI